MTTTAIDSALVGPWRAELTFTEGPREAEREPVTLTFLQGGVIVHADEIPAGNGQLPRGIGEWTSQDDQFSYWFNVVLNDPTGRPAVVVYVHGEGRLTEDRQTFTASGGSEVYGSAGELLATNRADLQATRVDDPRTDRGPATNTSDPHDPTCDQNSPLDQVGSAVPFENDRVRVCDDPDLDALKQGARVVWAAGDYPAIARVIAEAGSATARRAGAARGVRLLDVACGDGNVAIPAARAGATVTALDLTPELVTAGRIRAAAERVDISWVLGDAEELPFDAAGFDAVTSNFGAIFAPRHAVVASELARVCTPGGRIVITAWAPDGFNERVAEIAQSYLPQPPVPEPPMLWADPAHARACFDGTDVELSFQRDSIRARFASAQAMVGLMARSFGPLVLAREHLTQQGRWEELLAAITAECDRWAKPVPDGIQIDMDYLVIIGQKHINQPSSEET